MAKAYQYKGEIMDPRHPEQAISRMRELMKQYDRIETDMKKATTSAYLAQLEREGGLVVQEICLVAPRIHEAMMQTSRQRRHDISRGNIYEQMRDYAATAERVEESVENVETVGPTAQVIAINEAITKEAEIVEKPKKKTTRKKKTAKKAEK